MFKNTFDRILTVAFHAVAVCAVTIATIAGASLIQPEAAPSVTIAQTTAKAARSL